MNLYPRFENQMMEVGPSDVDGCGWSVACTVGRINPKLWAAVAQPRKTFLVDY